MKHLFVWARLADGALRRVGELAMSEASPDGRFQAEFEYSNEWANDRNSFALDPESLPLNIGTRRFLSEQFQPPLAVFDDALPDDWGRRLLATALKLDGLKPTAMEMLLRMRGGGTGALLFSESAQPPESDSTVASTALTSLLDAAARFEKGDLPDNAQFRRLLDGSSRVGGARPKALVHDAQGEWLAKFPSASRDEGHDVVGLEATCLRLAARARLEVPESRLQTIGRKRVLLLRRFDVTAANGRLHMISLRTLCKERPGIFIQSYSELAAAIRKHSFKPLEDITTLFRHMVFNCAIGNVDDHSKNFWMLSSSAGFSLSPAFDLVPDITGRGEHTLMFEMSFGCPTHAALLAMGRRWGVKGAAEIIEQVVAAVETFSSLARDLKVAGGTKLANIDNDIKRRLKLIEG